MLVKRRPHVVGSPVTVVGQAFDVDGDPAWPVPLVVHGLISDVAALTTRRALECPLDVVLGDRAVPGLLNGRRQGRVGVRIGAAVPGRSFDATDETREQLPAPGVGRTLLVLDRRPLGVTGQLCSSRCASSRKRPREPTGPTPQLLSLRFVSHTAQGTYRPNTPAPLAALRLAHGPGTWRPEDAGSSQLDRAWIISTNSACKRGSPVSSG